MKSIARAGGVIFGAGAGLAMRQRVARPAAVVKVRKSSLGDAESSLGDAESSLGDAESSLGDAKSSLGNAKSSLGAA
jgi:hypothetical protein